MKKLFLVLLVFALCPLASVNAANARLQVDTKTHALTDELGGTIIDAKAVTLTVGGMTIYDGAGVKTVVTGSTSGAMFGASGNKIGFLGATPIVRPSSTTDLRQALINFGLYTTGGASPLNLNGGAFTSGPLTATTGNFSGNETVGGTFAVTGATTLAGLTATTAAFSGAVSAPSYGAVNGTTATFSSSISATNAALSGTLGVTGNATIGGTLGVTGAITGPSLALTGNGTIGGTFGVTGHTTFEGVTSTGATGTGNLVYGTSPTLTNPSFSGNLGLASGSTMSIDGSVILSMPLTPSPANDARTNISLGYGALTSIAPISTTQYLTAVGFQAGAAVTTADHNTMIGSWALASATTQSNNTAIGVDVLRGLTSGAENTGVGEHAITEATTASFNTSVGNNSMFHTGGQYNVALGYFALFGNSTGTPLTGSNNTAVGAGTMAQANGLASENTAFGRAAGAALTTGNNNLFLGDQTGSGYPTTGSDNILIGTPGNLVNAPAADSSFTLNIANLIKGTAANDASTSIVTFTGTMPASATSFASVVMLGGLRVTNGINVSGAQNYVGGNLSVGSPPNPDSVLHVYTGLNKGGLRIGFNGTPANYYDADTHHFRLGDATEVATITSAGINVTGRLTTSGGVQPPHLADTAATNDTIYFSTDAGKLAYKDSGGVVHALY